ncbi:MAG: hypothetical protein HY238_07370 [Acidobacteria bacterium]|nr:hypothetical protein [Acidobacteriota bacterium]
MAGAYTQLGMAIAAAVLAACGASTRAPERCKNWISNSEWRSAEWKLPPFARIDDGSLLIGEGPANGAVARMLERPAALAGVGVVAVGYARVETPKALPATDDDVTARLWEGTVNLVNAYSKNGRDFPGPYARLRFTGREIASGCWKRFVTEAIPADRGRLLYPHFAFWGARLAAGVKLRLSSLSLVEAPAETAEPESWTECPALAAPAPALHSATRRQWEEGLAPDGAFGDSFDLRERPEPAEPGWRELLLTARYRQGPRFADRFLISVTEDGTDPRLSPTSHLATVLARRGAEQWEAVVRVRASAGSVAIATAAAVMTGQGLRAQAAVLPPAWQKGRL